MLGISCKGVVLSSALPDYVRNEVPFSELLIEQGLQPSLLGVIDRDDDYACVLQQPVGVTKPALHEAQPLRVTVRIGIANESIVVNPCTRTGVVRRVNVDQVDFALVRVEQSLECIVILAFDHHVCRLVAPSTDLAEGLQAGINRDAEVLNNDELSVRVSRGFASFDRLLRGIHCDDRCCTAPSRDDDVVLLVGIGAKSHDVAAPWPGAGNLEVLR